MSNRTLRKYDKEFKLNAVALYKTSDKSYPELSAELGSTGIRFAIFMPFLFLID